MVSEMINSPLNRRFAVALSLLASLSVTAACGGDEDSTSPPERIITALVCEPGGTDEFNCAMELQEEAGLQLDLETFTCGAHGNTIWLRQPVDQVLTTDACYLADDEKSWTFAGPYPPGTVVTLEIISAELELPADLQLTGEYPTWVIYFEDGGDRDYDDLVLTISAVP